MLANTGTSCSSLAVNRDAEPHGVGGRTAAYLCGVTLFSALQPAQDFNASLSFNAFLSPSFRITLFVLMFLPQDITKLMEGKWHPGELDLTRARQAN